MIEVFVPYSKAALDVPALEETLNAWTLPGMEPIALEVGGKKMALHARVGAENISSVHYMIVDIGYGPLEENFAAQAEEELRHHQDAGLFGFWRTGQTANELPNSVVLCRRGVIQKWPEPRGESSYVREHILAYQLAGYKTFLCSTIHYHHLNVSLPC